MEVGSDGVAATNAEVTINAVATSASRDIVSVLQAATTMPRNMLQKSRISSTKSELQLTKFEGSLLTLLTTSHWVILRTTTHATSRANTTLHSTNSDILITSTGYSNTKESTSSGSQIQEETEMTTPELHHMLVNSGATSRENSDSSQLQESQPSNLS